MSVIARSRLLGQRLRMLEQRRADLVSARAATIRAQGLPVWAGEVLQRVGMTAAELVAFDRHCAGRDAPSSLTELDEALAELDRSIAEAEAQLLDCDANAVDRLEAMADVAVRRLRRAAVQGEPAGEAGDSRALVIIEELLRELQRLQEGTLSHVG